MKVDVAIVGAGITGAMVADVLRGYGLTVAVLERAAARGSTAASTAMLLWEPDRSLVDLAGQYDFDRAARTFQRSRAALADLQVVLATLPGIAFAARDSLYLAPAGTGDARLAEEHRARQTAGLPGRLLDQSALSARFGMERSAAILSPGAAEADPVRLTLALLARAAGEGVRLIGAEVEQYRWEGERVGLELRSGLVVEAGHAVLATGYDLPAFLDLPSHRVASSWCIATEPLNPAALWPERVLVWEDASPYLYARTTTDGRIIAGGEDEPFSSAAGRIALTPQKVAALTAKLGELWPKGNYSDVEPWSAEFGQTTDGLPLIGRVPGAPRLLAAYGYGGNGITFSYMASRIISALVRGQERAWFEDYALDRQG